MYDDEIPIGRSKDLRGQTFNKLTVLYKTNPPAGSSKRTYWKCKCECGNITIVRGSHLLANSIKSCGCLRHQSPPNFIDLTGQKFNRLTVLYRCSNNDKNGHPRYHCKCDCGNECDVTGNDLKKGTTQSCGCLAKELSSKQHMVDITGQRFGKLIALYPIQLRKNQHVFWHCKCDCGNECDARGIFLRSGSTWSCGCETKRSIGEKQIKNLLETKNIAYTTQQTFQTCRFRDTNYLAFFDFYINQQYLLEFDGQQHFQAVDFFGGQEKFKQRQEHDQYKTQWCKDNNIPLIRIPYTRLKELCIEDLLLETTTFRVA